MRWSSSSSLIGAAAAGEPPPKLGRVEVERFGPERREGRPFGELVGAHQVERPETPGIIQREPPPLIGVDDEMVVLANLRRIDAPMAGHPEVEHQRVAAVGVDQSIFGASSEARDPRPGQPLAEIDRQCSPKVGSPRLDPLDAPALRAHVQPAHGGFDFGEFRHRGDMAEARQAR